MLAEISASFDNVNGWKFPDIFILEANVFLTLSMTVCPNAEPCLPARMCSSNSCLCSKTSAHPLAVQNRGVLRLISPLCFGFLIFFGFLVLSVLLKGYFTVRGRVYANKFLTTTKFTKKGSDNIVEYTPFASVRASRL